MKLVGNLIALSKGPRKPSEANIGKKWNNFYAANSLKENSKIEVEIHPNCSSKAYTKIIAI